MQEPTLLQLMENTDADLIDNRAGNLSPAQRERLIKIRRRNTLLGITAVSLLAILSMILLFYSAIEESLLLRIGGIALVLCNAALLSVWLRGRLRLSGDIDANRVEILTGKINHTIRVNGRLVSYLVAVGESTPQNQIQVSKAIFFAMPKDANMTLYRTPEARVLVGAEATPTQ